MLMRTDPFRTLERLTEQAFGTPARPAAMPVDAYRRGEEFVVEFDLPGVDAAAIDLTIEKNVLSVHAQRDRKTDGGVEFLMAERPQGSFSRQLFLGDALDPDHITATYTDGVLVLRIPITERAKPRRVDVTTTKSNAEAIEARAHDANDPVSAGV